MSAVFTSAEATKRPSSNLYDSDSDLSDTERLILERRRLNTEYMEQIEKERQEVLNKSLEEPKELIKSETIKTPEITDDGNDIEMKDVMSKSLEELEAERDALLQQVRNPEPPSSMEISGSINAIEFELPIQTKKVDTDHLEIRKQKKTKGLDVNGDVLRLKTTSESSTGESSPCAQVCIIFQICYTQLIQLFYNYFVGGW